MRLRRRKQKKIKTGEKAGFFVNFRVDFLFSPNMKPAPIYRGGRE
jgi:hypothetical protein